MLEIFMLFLYGWIAGVIAVPICYLYGLESFTQFVHCGNKVLWFLYAYLSGKDVAATHFRQTSYNESAISSTSLSALYSADSKTPLPDTTGVSPARHMSVCRLSYLTDHNVFGAAHDCRLVLHDKYLFVYEVQNSHGVGSHERVITGERLRGRVRTDRIVVQPSFLPGGSRRGGNAGAVHGHVLHIRPRDGGPLFEGDEENREGSPSVTYASFRGGTASNSGMTRSAKNNVGDSTVLSVNGIVKSSSGSSNQEKVYGSLAVAESDAESRPGNKHTIVVKFYYMREQERWQSLLEGQQEAAQWRDYLQTITTPDSFNLVLTRLFRQNMRTTALTNFIGAKLQKKFDELSMKNFPREIEGRILLDDFLIGEEVPIFSNFSSPKIVAGGEMIFDFDLLYRGGATLCLCLNLTYRGIRIPHVVFSVKIKYLSARMRVSVGPPPSKKFWLGILSPPDIRLEVHQGMQSGRGFLHRILISLPDLSPIASNLIKLYLMHDMGLPALDDFPLPSIEKTPPSSPNASQKKKWDMRFDRHNAVARSRGQVNLKQEPPASATLEEATIDGFGSNTKEESEFFSPARTPALKVIASVDEGTHSMGHGDSSSTVNVSGSVLATTATLRELSQGVLLSPSNIASLPPNSEDGRRLRLKVKARNVMRLAVKRVRGMPESLTGGSFWK
ncbi:hypothetical protein C3747_78g105 [Trypanosoma cruzi]|uniref:SMP-LTD domain-containing protein n=2 Tax=Trypanosoma cruzi TaxID=5693 RepID=Q4E5R0_TRYCC|nr:hypothetical protein, conserved [Trypanosoma cruzi]EAO00100.1 hypothetical protein, conserved [Trypanosoma cruzi]PWV09523.1 hypothetical protein C3747_78g105 [Trypanosoma cruzi]RNC51131.1 hypothetical protein TcCL_ESM11782 [Trypanosoma cruzi]|eukprot:XP_821951.1 hypothetical protein [Trypanosoma cruzi strain CL Brener]